MAKVAQQTTDPAALGALIPTDDGDDGMVTLGGDDTPPLLRHEPMPPPVSITPGNLQKARRVAGTQQAAAAAPVQPRKDIARMMPSAHRVYVYKKKEDGKQSFINEYTAQELQGAGTIEAFIKKYVVPHYEHGEYHVHYFDGQGKEPTPLGSVNIEAPIDYVSPVRTNGHSKQASPAESLREAMALQKEMQQMNHNQPPPKSQSDVMMETMMASMLKKQMESFSSGGGDKGGDGGGMGMMLMMMMMERMKPAPAPTVDPVIQRLMEKMADRIEAMEQEARVSQAMIPPPPLPSDGSSAHLEMILETMRENTRMMVEAMKSQQVTRDPIKDLADMAALMAPQKSESLTTKDLFELMPKFQVMFAPQSQNKDPFEKTMEHFRVFKMMQREFGEERTSQAPPSQQDSFWTFAKEMLKSDVGKSIAQQIVAQSNGQEIAQHGQQRVSNQQEQARIVANRRAQQAAQQRLLAEDRARKLASEATRVQQEEARVQPVAAPAEQPAEPAPAPEQKAPVSEVRAVEPEASADEEENNEVSVPEGFLNVHAALINDAPNDAERIGAIISGFQILATSPDFRPVITKMFGLCKQNRKIESLDHLVEILEFFSENEVLRAEIPKLAREDFDKHWNLIRQKLDFPDVPEVLPSKSDSESEDA